MFTSFKAQQEGEERNSESLLNKGVSDRVVTTISDPEGHGGIPLQDLVVGF